MKNTFDVDVFKFLKNTFIILGLSLKSQELTAIFLITRLGCSIYIEANIHTVFDSAFLLATLGVIYVMRFKLKKSYIKEFDTVHLLYLVNIYG